jgi:hypothetical protein
MGAYGFIMYSTDYSSGEWILFVEDWMRIRERSDRVPATWETLKKGHGEGWLDTAIT